MYNCNYLTIKGNSHFYNTVTKHTSIREENMIVFVILVHLSCLDFR